MSKRLIEAAEAALGSIVYEHRRSELQAALDEARKPVTVTPEQAIELMVTFGQVIGEEVTQADRDNAKVEEIAEMQEMFAAILNKARELGL